MLAALARQEVAIKRVVVLAEEHALAPGSARDAEFHLDVGHHRVRQARLAEFGEVVGDGALP